MNSSMDRWNTFRQLAGAGIVCGMCFGARNDFGGGAGTTAPKGNSPGGASPLLPQPHRQLAPAGPKIGMGELCLKERADRQRSRVCLVNHRGA